MFEKIRKKIKDQFVKKSLYESPNENYHSKIMATYIPPPMPNDITLLYELVTNCESLYSNKEVYKLQLDVLAKTAQRLIDEIETNGNNTDKQ